MSMADFSTRPLASLEMTEEDVSLVPDEVAEAAVNLSFRATEEASETTVDLSFRPTEGSGEIFPDIHEYTAATAIPIHTEKK